LSLNNGSKSPPGVAHRLPGLKVWIHVASPSVAGAPPPSPEPAFEVPSPQSESSLWSWRVPVWTFGESTWMISSTLSMIAPSGIGLRSKAMSALEAIS